MNGKNTITIAVCTFKRQKLLEKLLLNLNNQFTNDEFLYSAAVVDNDREKSAEPVIKTLRKKCSYELQYVCEPVKSITQARNRAVQNAGGDFLAFIDDDEYPDRMWLYNHYKSIHEYAADGILGPVLPYFEIEPPDWLVKSRLCNRKTFSTGTVLKDPVYTRTGNVLLRMSLFENTRAPFDNRFGSTGGEDSHFFATAINNGKVFIWCNEAIVHELVPEYRFTRRYYIQRALLRGALNARNSSFVSKSTAKSLIASGLYTISLPFLFLAGQHHFMKYLVRNCDHIGKILSHLGIEPVKDRSFQA